MMTFSTYIEIQVDVSSICEEIQLYNGKPARFTLTASGDDFEAEWDIELDGDELTINGGAPMPNPASRIIGALMDAQDRSDELMADDETRDDADRPSDELQAYLDDLPTEELGLLFDLVRNTR